MKIYSRPARRHEQAHQMWPILAAWAVFRRCGRLEKPGFITYGELASFMGYEPQAGRTLGRALGLVSHLCDNAGLPHLNAIVVDYETGEPGAGIPMGATSPEIMAERVINTNWFQYRQPTMNNFKALLGE